MSVSTRTKLIIAFVIVLGVIGVLIKTAVSRSSTYYITVSELYAQQHSPLSETAVSGDIVGASVEWDPSTQKLQFSMKDQGAVKTLPVLFHGDKPDDFANDWPVIVFGQLNQQGTFIADKLLIKCPSKYNAKEQTQTFTSKS